MAIKSYLVLAGCLVLCVSQPIQQNLPVLKEQPLEVLFKDTAPALLECAIDGGNGNVKYSWHKDGKSFSLTSDITQRKGEGSLEFRTPKTTDEGVYQCFAETEQGIASSRPIFFKRAYWKPAPITKPKEHTAVQGRPFKLDCQVPEGYPKPVVFWRTQIEGSEPEDYLNRRVTPSPNGPLWFSNVTEEDVNPKMKYICLAKSSEFAEEVIAEHYITSMEKDTKPKNGDLVPQYLSNDIIAKATDVTMIWCIYGGTPLAHPDWYKDGKNVNGDSNPAGRITRHNRTSGRRLLIRQTVLEDAGTYKCVANNEVGKPLEHSIKLSVVSAPFFALKPEQRVLRKSGEDIYIACKFIGEPTPKASYTFNGKPLATNDRISTNDDGITIKNAQSSDNGYYGCGAVNEHGKQYAESLVFVN